MNIHGIVVTRNDWGPLPVAICHAFSHVDVVHVLNHGSDDQTAHGLEVLKAMWGDRLIVRTAGPDVAFDQSLLTNILVSEAEARGADWIYVFDSDEFLLTSPGNSLRDILSKVNSKDVAVRYVLKNYISPTWFDKLNLDHYLSLSYRSRPVSTYDPHQAWSTITAGTSTFFDVPFPPKIFFRAKAGLMITDGAHGLRWVFEGQAVTPGHGVSCAHVPLISRDTLKRKSAMGAWHIQSGRPRARGWQSQLIHHLDQEGRLDWFWAMHSIGELGSEAKNPDYVMDDSLVHALAPALQQLRHAFGSTDLGSASGEPVRTGSHDPTVLQFDDVFRLCQFFDQRIKRLASTKRP